MIHHNHDDVDDDADDDYDDEDDVIIGLDQHY